MMYLKINYFLIRMHTITMSSCVAEPFWGGILPQAIGMYLQHVNVSNEYSYSYTDIYLLARLSHQ